MSNSSGELARNVEADIISNISQTVNIECWFCATKEPDTTINIYRWGCLMIEKGVAPAWESADKEIWTYYVFEFSAECLSHWGIPASISVKTTVENSESRHACREPVWKIN